MAKKTELESRAHFLPIVFTVLSFTFVGGWVLPRDDALGESTCQGDTVVSYVRIYADAEGESHFQDVDVSLDLVEVAPGISPLFASPFFHTSRYAFLRAEPGWREEWHPAPQRQFLVYLKGVTEFQVGDGEIRRLGPGTILLAEDTVEEGHISEVVGGRTS